jgi:hypothetical protein
MPDSAAEDAGFDVLLKGDLSIEYQQNISGRNIAIVSLSANNWRIVQNYIPAIAGALQNAHSGSFSRVDCGIHKAVDKPRNRTQD